MRLTSQKAIKQAHDFWTNKRYRGFAAEVWPKRKEELKKLHLEWRREYIVPIAFSSPYAHIYVINFEKSHCRQGLCQRVRRRRESFYIKTPALQINVVTQKFARVVGEAQEYGTSMYSEHCAVTMNNLSPIGWFVIRAKQMTGCSSVEGFACVDGFSAPSLGLNGEFPEEVNSSCNMCPSRTFFFVPWAAKV